MRLIATLVLSVCLIPVMTDRVTAADAIAGGNGGSLALGKNWGPYETFKGAAFRWVANDAEIIVRGGTGPVRVTIACEGGPSLGQPAFALRVLDTAKRQVDHAQCAGPNTPATLLLPPSGGEAHYVLHVDGGGRAVPNEKRVLNFRVFSIDAGGGAAAVAGNDIVNPRNGVRLGDHWYTIEHFKGQTFRWVDHNDAQIFVTSDRDMDTKLRLLVALGPSVGARESAVAVRDSQNHVLLRATVKNQQALLVPVHLKTGENEFIVGVETKNQAVPGEKRLLNLRVFSIAALR
jgi:hypothetical protein